MKKLFLGLFAALAALTLVGCGKTPAKSDSKYFHIMAWNEEFKGFFEKYVCDEKDQFMQAAEKKDDSLKPKTYHYDGKEVKWTIVPSEDGQYQKALDLRLKENENASDEERIDMFLAEADYILKYSNSDYTTPIKDLGVSNLTNTYKYTSQVASDSKGVVKGVSFQCCPAGVIYRRSIAKAVLGTDDPAQVQKKISSWSKFDAVAAEMKAKGYYMTSSYAETYRAFSNNVTKPWVNDDEKLQFDSQIEAWMDQAETYIKNGYTMTHGIWEEGCTNEMFATGKTFCWFGPAWYYNFCMGSAQDETKGCYGDWAVCEGPAYYYWGGTWLMGAAGGNDDYLVGKCMNSFINDLDVCKALVKNEGQFSNNQRANKEVAAEYEKEGTGNAFLGGQNDTKLYLDLAKRIKIKGMTIYDQYCNEGLQNAFGEYLKGIGKTDAEVKTKEQAIANFKTKLAINCPEIVFE